MADRELATTRIALLELGEERRTAREGYALLDEKRMLLAARALALAETLAARRREWHEAWIAAVHALGAALDRHGVQALEAWPIEERPLEFELHEQRMLGVPLPRVVLGESRADGAPPFRPADPSPEVVACVNAWRTLLERAATLAALETSLWRLADEYRRTERRTAAIEHVLLPELEHAIGTIEQALESGDQEEAVRVRNAARARHGAEQRRAGG
jgi:V/A-type H+/Na+-transporting ATPase subunit D